MTAQKAKMDEKQGPWQPRRANSEEIKAHKAKNERREAKMAKFRPPSQSKTLGFRVSTFDRLAAHIWCRLTW